jgi:serine/threonine protein kinase
VREIQAMRLCRNHDNIVKYYGAYIVDFFDRKTLWIVMELLDCGSLWDYMKHTGVPLSEVMIKCTWFFVGVGVVFVFVFVLFCCCFFFSRIDDF